MTQVKTKIPAEMEPAAVGGMVTDSKYVIDREQNKTQTQINTETNGRVTTLEEAVGEGGSVDERITVEKNRAEQAEGTLDGKIATEKTRAEGVEGGLNTRLQTVEQLAEISVGGGDIGIGTAADFESDDPEDLAKVPTIGAVLGSMDDEPTAGSDNLVKSGGVFKEIAIIKGNTYEDTDSLVSGGSFVKDVEFPIERGGKYSLMITLTANIQGGYGIVYENYTDGTRELVKYFSQSDKYDNDNLQKSLKSITVQIIGGGILSDGNITIKAEYEGEIENIKKDISDINAYYPSIKSEVYKNLGGNYLFSADLISGFGLNKSFPVYVKKGDTLDINASSVATISFGLFIENGVDRDVYYLTQDSHITIVAPFDISSIRLYAENVSVNGSLSISISQSTKEAMIIPKDIIMCNDSRHSNGVTYLIGEETAPENYTLFSILDLFRKIGISYNIKLFVATNFSTSDLNNTFGYNVTQEGAGLWSMERTITSQTGNEMHLLMFKQTDTTILRYLRFLYAEITPLDDYSYNIIKYYTKKDYVTEVYVSKDFDSTTLMYGEKMFASVIDAHEYLAGALNQNINMAPTIIRPKNRILVCPGVYDDWKLKWPGVDGETGTDYKGILMLGNTTYESFDVNYPEWTTLEWDGSYGFSPNYQMSVDNCMARAMFHLVTEERNACVRGFNLVSQNTRYCVHMDASGGQDMATNIVDKCIINFGGRPRCVEEGGIGIGFGVCPGETQIYSNIKFVNNTLSGHDCDWENNGIYGRCKVVVKNCNLLSQTLGIISYGVGGSDFGNNLLILEGCTNAKYSFSGSNLTWRVVNLGSDIVE